MDNNILDKLEKSAFRSRFKLNQKYRDYVLEKGLAVVCRHAADLICQRLAPAVIANDGRQTPMKNHPVFIAQHATATCCRQCLYKWHKIEPGIELSLQQQEEIVNLIMAWIERQTDAGFVSGR